ncbi:MAG: AGE family epimerase/isomerase [Candidatus Hydrogenedentes bacterium]|nr:AGE family epimerase/isomerase [Candidatus Hydrogenedentota bacterium]
MDLKPRVQRCLEEMRHHLFNELLPFWKTHGPDLEYGGFLTYFDSEGNPTGETTKTLLCQLRCIFTYSSLHRQNLDPDGTFLEYARQGVDFVTRHYWDDRHTGWFWTADRQGNPIDRSKIMYGHCFGVYAMSEYGMASGDPRGLEYAMKTYEAIKIKAADFENGGVGEFFEEDWTLKKPGVYGGDRKSFDIHMHMMEAFTNLYEATGSPLHRLDLERSISLIYRRIIEPEYGIGLAQFTYDWQPLRAILFKNVWGSDRDVDDPEGRPLDNTSYGHNIEFIWLLLHALNILGKDIEPYREKIRKTVEHTAQWGVDWERGGLFCEGPKNGPARERNKEFWQQAEALVGFLDGYLLFGEQKYWDAYENIHRFLMDYGINHKVGEWWPLLDEHNNILWTYMGHAWKINYHTVRAAVQSERRLAKVLGRLEG